MCQSCLAHFPSPVAIHTHLLLPLHRSFCHSYILPNNQSQRRPATGVASCQFQTIHLKHTLRVKCAELNFAHHLSSWLWFCSVSVGYIYTYNLHNGLSYLMYPRGDCIVLPVLWSNVDQPILGCQIPQDTPSSMEA